jgi:molecular chaperone GrpE
LAKKVKEENEDVKVDAELEKEAATEDIEENVETKTTEEETTEEESSEDTKKDKKDKKDLKIEELTDRVTRQMAEFENFRKRTEKEKSSMYAAGAKDTIEKILPIVDNFERALACDSSDEAFKDGMDKIYRMMLKNLEEMGVVPIDAKGKPFDPNFHNAVMHIDDDSFGENEVVEELQKGYMYKDTILRHSMVKVAN